ncbi:hypothetical protein BH11PSE12_BH11PSE12_19740 [soil metagenome]
MKIQSRYRSHIKHKDGVSTLMDLYQRLPFFAHSSKMFVNNIEDKFYENLSKNTIDIEIHVEHAKKGNIYHLDESLGVYRVNCGMTKTLNGVNILLPAATRRIYFNALENIKDKIEIVELKKYYSRSILNYAYQSALLGREKECRAYAWESISIKLISIWQISIWALTFFPAAVSFLANFRKKLRSNFTKT